jgi:hypothetical protein
MKMQEIAGIATGVVLLAGGLRVQLPADVIGI